MNSIEPVMLEASFNRPVCFLAQNTLFLGPLIRILRHLTPFISIDKGNVDASAVMQCIRYVREGGVLAVYPEGNLTYDGELGYMNPSIIKLVRVLRVPVIYYTVRGGYGLDPRFGTSLRRGYMHGGVTGRRSVAEIDAMTDKELFADIRKMLTVDEFSVGLYRSKKSAEALERVLYRCPFCGSVESIKSSGRFVHCVCGLCAEYRDNLTFNFIRGECGLRYVRDWIRDELEWVKSFVPERGSVIFRDEHVKLEKRKPDMSYEKPESGSMEMTGEHISVCGKTFLLSKLSNMVQIKKQILLLFTAEQEVYRITSPNVFCALKYIHMFHRLRQLRTGVFDNYFGM
ncbi:MAG: 1-acyl-sn-glycerol-3-phosphate acyltransferase [Clostridiales bacterium]|nr:1-acyl-sn-glycerol-3-phosphate acyltransferase [Clostridiales bacterium]